MKRAEQLVKENETSSVHFFGPSSATISNPNASQLVPEHSETMMVRMSSLYNDLYRGAHEREKSQNAAAVARGLPPKSPPKRARTIIPSDDGDTQMDNTDTVATIPTDLLERVEKETGARKAPNGKNANNDALTIVKGDTNGTNGVSAAAARAKSATVLALQSGVSNRMRSSTSIAETLVSDRPTWHAPWRIYRTISGHLGWVRCAAVDSSNEWFATGSADRTIKIWSLSTGQLRLTLPGHVAGVRGLEVSSRHPYLFSVGEDKAIKCWDLEQNKVVRKYHGSLSGVYALGLHPTLNVLVTGGRDSAVRVWDMRTRVQVMNLGGHRDGINSLIVQKYDPQIVSASVDSTVRLWDLTAGKCASVLTNHKRGVRSVVANPAEFSFASASIDAIKTWAFPHGNFMRNLRSTEDGNNNNTRTTLVNCMAVNEDGVLASGGNDGTLKFWDYASAHAFQHTNTIVQPGSLDCERGILETKFDKSGSRLISCETDKTIKMWKEDTDATPESHPIDWKPDLRPRYY